jgi:hypothetical protein
MNQQMQIADLQRYLNLHAGGNESNALENIKKRIWAEPFWISDKEEHKQKHQQLKGDCCAWHIVPKLYRHINGR